MIMMMMMTVVVMMVMMMMMMITATMVVVTGLGYLSTHKGVMDRARYMRTEGAFISGFLVCSLFPSSFFS